MALKIKENKEISPNQTVFKYNPIVTGIPYAPPGSPVGLPV